MGWDMMGAGKGESSPGEGEIGISRRRSRVDLIEILANMFKAKHKSRPKPVTGCEYLYDK